MRACVVLRQSWRCGGAAVLLFLVVGGLAGCGSSADVSKSSTAKSDDAPAPHPFAKAMSEPDDTVPGVVPGTDNSEKSERVVASNSQPQESSPIRTQQKPGSGTSPMKNVASQPRQELGQPKRRPATTPSSDPVSRPTGAATVASIHLSTGTKLPVSLPNGTNMAFTAEYRFTSGQPLGNVQYVWVIEGRGGKRVRVPLKLMKGSGKLPQFFTRELLPGDEPFRSYIEAWPLSSGRPKPRAGVRISNSVPMS